MVFQLSLSNSKSLHVTRLPLRIQTEIIQDGLDLSSDFQFF